MGQAIRTIKALPGAFAAFAKGYREYASEPTHLCRGCNTFCKPESIIKINRPLAFVLLCCLGIPGILYLLWASRNKEYMCPNCKRTDALVAINNTSDQ